MLGLTASTGARQESASSTAMKVSRQQLELATSEGMLSIDQAGALYDYLEHRPGAGLVFRFSHILDYPGGLTAIGAMTLFMNLGREEFGGRMQALLPQALRELLAARSSQV